MVYIFLAEGFEEAEAIVPVDILRRLGIPVVTVGVDCKNVTGSHNITVVADTEISFADFSDITAIILPGGMPGTLNLQKNEKLCALLKQCSEKGVIISALCAAPSILGGLGLLKGREYTCYPGFEKSIDGIHKNIPLVIDEGDNTLITAWGPGSAYRFGFALAEKILGKDVSKLKKSMMMCGDE